MAEKESKLFDQIKNIWKGGKIKKDNFLILILLGILLLVIVWPTSDSGIKNETENSKSGILDSNGDILDLSDKTVGTSQGNVYDEEELDAYTGYLEEKLESILSVMEGAGKVKVMITLSSSQEVMVEKDIPTRRSSMTEVDAEGGSRNTSDMELGQETVFVSDKSGNMVPFVKKTLQPDIKGVVVAVQGGGNAKIIQNITEAIQALFGIDQHKIKIVKMIS